MDTNKHSDARASGPHPYSILSILKRIVLVCVILLPVSVIAMGSLGAQSFRLVVVPDTQYYSRSYPWILNKQMEWIAKNAKKDNTLFVTQLGDIVQDWNDESQWKAADRSFKILDGTVPYGIAPGNHDLGPGGKAPYFEKYFPESRISFSKDGDFGRFDAKNSYHTLNAGGVRLIVLNLEFCPPDAVTSWLDRTLTTYADHAAIIATHSFINASGQRTRVGENHSCDKYDVAGKNTGQDMWDKVIHTTRHDNVIMVLSGHDMDSPVGAARREDIVNGHTVYQMLSNYQELGMGGDGYVRLLDFNLEKNSVRVSTYSPITNTYKQDDANQFTLPLSLDKRFKTTN